MKRRVICALTLIILFLCFCSVAYSHNKEGYNGHDQFLSYVLFGTKTYKSSLLKNSVQYKKLVLLEDAVALCLDQYNGKYDDELRNLNQNKIHGIPKEIETIDFNSNQHHRRYTHLGWNKDYTIDKGKWNCRKTILLQTVNYVFGFSKRAGEWKLLWGTRDYGYNQQCEAFSELIYYIHVLVDYDDSDYDEVYSDLEKLAREHPSDTNPDIYYEILNLLPDLFPSQLDSPSYSSLVKDIKQSAKEARNFVAENTDMRSNFSQYKEYASELMSVLHRKIPDLLENEPFFTDVFE